MATREIDTLIVGGGMAGMFCALRLKEAGLPFLLLTDRLGGRVMYKPEYRMNFGAVLYFASDRNIATILKPKARALGRPWRIEMHRDGEHYPLLSLKLLRVLPRLLRFRRFMRVFAAHYAAYKANCETMQAREAMQRDPFLWRLHGLPSARLLDELGVAEACAESVSFFAYTCAGVPVDTLSAFDYCCLAQGLLVPMNFFAFDEEEMRTRLGNVEFDTVVAVSRADGKNHARTAVGHDIAAHNLVLATSSDAADALIGLPHKRSGTRLYSYLVKGVVRETYRGRSIHLFAVGSPVLYLARRDGTDDEFEIFANEKLDLGNYFAECRVLFSKEWPAAIYARPALLIDQELGDNRYLAGDHNGIGMEAAAISGLYAANRIIASSRA